MSRATTTVRITLDDKKRLEELCQLGHRGILHQVAFLIAAERERLGLDRPRSKRRKAG